MPPQPSQENLADCFFAQRGCMHFGLSTHQNKLLERERGEVTLFLPSAYHWSSFIPQGIHTSTYVTWPFKKPLEGQLSCSMSLHLSLAAGSHASVSADPVSLSKSWQVSWSCHARNLRDFARDQPDPEEAETPRQILNCGYCIQTPQNQQQRNQNTGGARKPGKATLLYHFTALCILLYLTGLPKLWVLNKLHNHSSVDL